MAGPQVMAVTGHGEFGRRAAEPASAEHACQLSAQLACPACPAGGPSHGSTLHTGQLRPTAPSVDRGVDLPQRPDAPQCGEGQRLCPDDPGRLSGCLTVTVPTIVLVWAAWRPRMTTGCRRVRGRELGEAVCPPSDAGPRAPPRPSSRDEFPRSRSQPGRVNVNDPHVACRWGWANRCPRRKF